MNSQPIQTKRELLQRLHNLEGQLRELGVRRLALFGSFVREQQGAGSDVDLLVEFEPTAKSFDNFMAIAELLENTLRRRVELVTREALSPYLGPRILSESQDVLLAA